LSELNEHKHNIAIKEEQVHGKKAKRINTKYKEDRNIYAY